MLTAIQLCWCNRRCLRLHGLRYPHHHPRRRSRLRCRQRSRHRRCRILRGQSRAPPEMGRHRTTRTPKEWTHGPAGQRVGHGGRARFAIHELRRHPSLQWLPHPRPSITLLQRPVQRPPAIAPAPSDPEPRLGRGPRFSLQHVWSLWVPGLANYQS
jgi:hypothetical protein